MASVVVVRDEPEEGGASPAQPQVDYIAEILELRKAVAALTEQLSAERAESR